MSEQTWAPSDGAGGVIYLRYDANDICTVHEEAMTWLLERAGFVRQDAAQSPTPPTIDQRGASDE